MSSTAPVRPESEPRHADDAYPRLKHLIERSSAKATDNAIWWETETPFLAHLRDCNVAGQRVFSLAVERVGGSSLLRASTDRTLV